MGIRETIRLTLAKIVMRAAVYHARMACGNLHMCAGLEADIYGSTRTKEDRRIEIGKRGAVESE